MRDIDCDLQIGKKGVLSKKSYLVLMLVQLFSTFFCLLDQDISIFGMQVERNGGSEACYYLNKPLWEKAWFEIASTDRCQDRLCLQMLYRCGLYFLEVL